MMLLNNFAGRILFNQKDSRRTSLFLRAEFSRRVREGRGDYQFILTGRLRGCT